jgi:hypothetical protein
MYTYLLTTATAPTPYALVHATLATGRVVTGSVTARTWQGAALHSVRVTVATPSGVQHHVVPAGTGTYVYAGPAPDYTAPHRAARAP